MIEKLAVRPQRHPGITLKQLVELLGVEPVNMLNLAEDQVLCDEKYLFSGVTNDSRKVRQGDIYYALPGENLHGAVFGRQAVAASAAAIVTDVLGLGILRENKTSAQMPEASERVAAETIPVFVVDDPRSCLGKVAARIYGTDSWMRHKPLFAVTGTNGKTTTSYFINSLLRALGKNPGIIGTIEISVGQKTVLSQLTTPEAADIHAYLQVMVEAGADALSMEASSHALKFGRVDQLHFRVAGFTNLTQDHLDFHDSMEEYFQAKTRLFTTDYTHRAVIVMDGSQDYSWSRRLWSYSNTAGVDTTLVLINEAELPDGVNERSGCVWQVNDILPQGWGHHFWVRSATGVEFEVHTALPGVFNVANAALALVMVHESGFFSVEQLRHALDEKPFTVNVPGRMQLVSKQPAVIIDFAHNPEAMKLVFEACAPGAAALPGDDHTVVEAQVLSRRLIVVCGATGQRDRLKRPRMGEIAVEYADMVIITDDDPHDEDPGFIRREVLEGAYRKQTQLKEYGVEREVFEVFPRDKAIERAVGLAHAQDIVLVLGRGHETVQDVAGHAVELDDRSVARQAVRRRGWVPVEET